ncbi:MAG: lipopolysaccharide heptosyltransferase II [Magnetococcales bacterium]|nr:lipopolysaccharide heptosyltransferase II [Magnetococcales bacterium]
MVMAQPLFQLLKRQIGPCLIDVLAPAWSLPLVERMPEVRAGIDLPLRHGDLGLVRRYRLGKELQGHYRQAIVLPNSFKSALVPFFARIPRRTGFIGEGRLGLLNDMRRLDRKLYPQTVQRFAALSLDPGQTLPTPLPIPQLTLLPQRVCATFRGLGIPLDGHPNLALCPGAEFGPAKRWPLHHFQTLARECTRQGWRVVVLGSAKERTLGEAICPATAGNCLNLAGTTSLEESVDLLSFVQAVVTNDSGLMHVAAALNRPVIALFGSSDPNHTPPMATQAHILTRHFPCAPCFKRQCPQGDPPPCLEQITPDQVLETLHALTAQGSRPTQITMTGS